MSDGEAMRTALPVVSCEGCGLCCTYMGTPPGYSTFFLYPGEMQKSDEWRLDYLRLMDAPVEVREELRAYYEDVQQGKLEDRTLYDVPCLWFDERTRKCKHYEWRPDVCREFKVGEEDCLRVRQAGGAPCSHDPDLLGCLN